mmetsp:Transcript_122824/g.342243  ORF Transcript_122824/g.342243 Transcript_122824/m.342243 type:complete len:356 (+) Transcript_122824:48-1115(+)
MDKTSLHGQLKNVRGAMPGAGSGALASNRHASMVPEAQRWHDNLRDLEATKNAAEQEHREAVADKDAEVDRWRKTAKVMQSNRDVAEQKARDVEADAMYQVNSIKWLSVQQATEYEDRICALEQLLAEERRGIAEERRVQAQLLQHAHEEADARVREAQRSCDAAVAAAEARAREAEDRAEVAAQRSAREVAQARAVQEACVTRARQLADAQVRDTEERWRFELEHVHSRVTERQRAMEETLFVNGRHRSEGLSEARRQATVLGQDLRELRLARTTDQAMKEGRLSARKELADLEKALHARTVDRIAGRLAQPLAGEEGDHADKALRGLLTGGAPGISPAMASSPLARVGVILAE